MRKFHINILTALALPLLLLLCACDREGFTERTFISREGEVSLTVGGVKVFTYNPALHQLGYNDKRHEFRAFDDSFSRYFVVKCDYNPSRVGDLIDGSVEWTDPSGNVNSKNVTFKISKIHNDNGKYIWLWCEKERIGAVVTVLK